MKNIIGITFFNSLFQSAAMYIYMAVTAFYGVDALFALTVLDIVFKIIVLCINIREPLKIANSNF